MYPVVPVPCICVLRIYYIRPNTVPELINVNELISGSGTNRCACVRLCVCPGNVSVLYRVPVQWKWMNNTAQVPKKFSTCLLSSSENRYRYSSDAATATILHL